MTAKELQAKMTEFGLSKKMLREATGIGESRITGAVMGYHAVPEAIASYINGLRWEKADG